ncbi:MAG: beta-lactamase family protein [Hungatella sp.]|nr:beta-lactamase family protein [Hungatella sp.]
MDRMNGLNQQLAENLVESIMKDYDACGIAAAVIDGAGVTRYEKFWGVRDQESGLEVNGETIFGLASVTKSFTALAIMQMEEKGLLELDDAVSKYIPEFTNKNQKKVTIRHLMSHCGGFFPLPRILVGNVAESLGLKESEVGDFAYNDAIAQEGVRLVAGRLDEQTMEQGLNGEPGQYLSYCNDGFGLLSDIIRRYGGEASYADYLLNHILKPLGMERSFCDFVRPAEDSNAATLYKKVDGVMKGSRDYHDNAFVLNGGGAMKSTLNDLKKYLSMYLNQGRGLNGTRILSQYGIGEMCKPRQPYGAFGYYGYGLSTKQLDDLKVVEHGGSLPGVSSNIAFSYEADAAVIVLCNTSGVPVSLISNALLRAYNGKNPVEKRDLWQEASWDEKTIKEVTGTYVSGEGTKAEIYKREDGAVVVKEEDKEKVLIPVSSKSAIIRGKYSDLFVRLIESEEKGIYAVAYGSRLIPKVKP